MDAFWSFYNFKQLRVVVVGSKSNGLAAAVALRRAGHLVEIYAPEIDPSYAQTTADSCNTLLETAISIEGKGTPCKLFVDHTCDSIDPVSGTVTFKNGVTLTADLIVDSGGARNITPTTENPNQPCVNHRLCLLNDASHATEDAVALEVIFSDKQNFTRNVKDGLGLYKTVSKARQVTPVDKEASETFDLSDVYMRVTQEVSRLKARNNTHLSLLGNRLNNDRIMFAMRI